MDKKSVKIALLQHDLTHNILAARFGCHRTFVSLALSGRRDSLKAQQIREFVFSLINNRKAA